MILSVTESFEVESVVWGYHVCKDAWSAAVGTLRLHLLSQPQTVPSLRGRPGQTWAKRRSVHNTPYFAMRLATLAFSYVPHITVPLSIMVYTTGFISSLIASVLEDIWHGLWQRSILAWKDTRQNSITSTKTIIFFHAFVNFETLKQQHFVLIPKVNILRVTFSRMVINS